MFSELEMLTESFLCANLVPESFLPPGLIAKLTALLAARAQLPLASKIVLGSDIQTASIEVSQKDSVITIRISANALPPAAEAVPQQIKIAPKLTSATGTQVSIEPVQAPVATAISAVAVPVITASPVPLPAVSTPTTVLHNAAVKAPAFSVQTTNIAAASPVINLDPNGAAAAVTPVSNTIKPISFNIASQQKTPALNAFAVTTSQVMNIFYIFNVRLF